MKTSITTDQAPKADHILSQAIAANGFIFASGQIHSTTDGKLVDGTTEEKLSQIMFNIQNILEAGGSSLANVVKVTIYLTDIEELKKLNEIYAAYFTHPLPAREAICVKALPLGASIEISVVATT